MKYKPQKFASNLGNSQACFFGSASRALDFKYCIISIQNPFQQLAANDTGGVII